MSVLHPRPQRRTTYLSVSPLQQVSARSLTERLVTPAAPEGSTARAFGAVRGVATYVTTAASLRLPKRTTL